VKDRGDPSCTLASIQQHYKIKYKINCKIKYKIKTRSIPIKFSPPNLKNPNLLYLGFSTQSGYHSPANPMVKILQAKDLTLHAVKQRFNLQAIPDLQFFPEWQNLEQQLTEYERHWLDQVKLDFLSLADYPLHEEIVKLSIVAPILSLSGLCRAPFVPAAEKQVEVHFPFGEDLDFESEDEETELIRGRIDLLILHQNLWVTTIETKPKQADVLTALPQALFYMMASPETTQPLFGLITNGHHFLFLKLLKADPPCYGLSNLLTLLRQPDNELYEVVTILKSLRDRVLNQDWQTLQVS
jgi:hypothetical protein